MSPQVAILLEILLSTGFANLEPEIKTENSVVHLNKFPFCNYEWSVVHSRSCPEPDVSNFCSDGVKLKNCENFNQPPLEFQEIAE